MGDGFGLQLTSPGYKKKEMEQGTFFEKKLEYEIDAWDLYSALNEGEQIVVIDARSAEAYETEHIL